jgi:hypothetical protein
MKRDYNFIGTYLRDEVFNEFYSKGRAFSISKDKQFIKNSEYALIDKETRKGVYVACLYPAKSDILNTAEERIFKFDYNERKYLLRLRKAELKISPRLY